MATITELRTLSQPSLAQPETTSHHSLDRPHDVDTTSPQGPTTAEPVPDGGYGWIVLLACAIVAWWGIGTTYCWGIIQAALVAEGLAKASTLSFVGSLTVSFAGVLGIANSKLVTTIGARNAGLIGITLLAAGLILGGFATKNLGALFVTIGVLMGLGVRYVLLHGLGSMMAADSFPACVS
jgi:hypothetical protein